MIAPAGEVELLRRRNVERHVWVADAAQHRTHACKDLRPAERLGDIVVGAHVQARDAVAFLSAGADHDDRDLAARPHHAADVEAAFARQHDVEQDQIDRTLGHGGLQFAAVGGAGHVVAAFAQDAGEQRADARIVVDDDDVVRDSRYPTGRSPGANCNKVLLLPVIRAFRIDRTPAWHQVAPRHSC